MNPMIFAIAALVLLVIACVLDRWSKHAGDVRVVSVPFKPEEQMKLEG